MQCSNPPPIRALRRRACASLWASAKSTHQDCFESKLLDIALANFCGFNYPFRDGFSDRSFRTPKPCARLFVCQTHDPCGFGVEGCSLDQSKRGHLWSPRATSHSAKLLIDVFWLGLSSAGNCQHAHNNDPGTDCHHQHTSEPIATWVSLLVSFGVLSKFCSETSRY